MRRRIHAARQTRDDDLAAFAQLLGQAARDALAARRGDARPDDGHAGPLHQGRIAQRPQ